MIRFFGKPTKEELDATENRLRTLEWKVNLILAIVGVQLLIVVAMFAKDLMELVTPSWPTIIVVAIVLGAIIWFFRKQIPGMIRRGIARQIAGEDLASSDRPKRETEDSIR